MAKAYENEKPKNLPLVAPANAYRQKEKGQKRQVEPQKVSRQSPALLTNSPPLPGRQTNDLGVMLPLPPIPFSTGPHGVSRPPLDMMPSHWSSPLPSLEMMPSHGPNEPEVTAQQPPEPPIEIVGDRVRANPRYGKPEAPDMARRGLAERLGDVTGGAIPDSMEGFMVANYMQNQLRQDDSRRVGDAKDIYKADLSALPSYMAEDRAYEMAPYKQQYQSALSDLTAQQALSAPGEREQTKAETAQILKETKEMLTNDQAMAQATDQDLRKTATALAKEAIRANPELNEDPTTIANETAAIYAMLKLRHQQIQKGAMPKYVPGQEDTAWFSDNSTQPALEWNFTE